MRVRIAFTIDVNDDDRRTIAHYYGKEGLASREDVRTFLMGDLVRRTDNHGRGDDTMKDFCPVCAREVSFTRRGVPHAHKSGGAPCSGSTATDRVDRLMAKLKARGVALSANEPHTPLHCPHFPPCTPYPCSATKEYVE